MKIVTAKEVAGFLKLTESTIYTLATEGKLPGFRIGSSWRFDMDDIMHQIKVGRETSLKVVARKADKKSSLHSIE